MSSEEQAIEAYNLGLEAKYEGNWAESLAQNQRADKLRPGDEATLWNLGIAATALREWDEARRAWKACGIEVNDGPGEVIMPRMSGCVRLDPKGAAEVVWGTRIDPARTIIASVPLLNRTGDAQTSSFTTVLRRVIVRGMEKSIQFSMSLRSGECRTIQPSMLN